MPCFPIKVRAFRLASALQNAAAAYDAQEEDLITKTRKIIAANNRALREAEAVLKRR
jgi:hypothetical protein